MEEQVVSFLLQIDITDDSFDWENWYLTSKSIISDLGYKCNYFGINSDHFHSGKVLQLRRGEKRLLNEFKGYNNIEYLQIQSLPADFKTSIFDYEAEIYKYPDFILLTVNKSDSDKVDIHQFISQMEKYTKVMRWEVFEMSRYEIPPSYAAHDNPVSFFKTLRVINSGK